MKNISEERTVLERIKEYLESSEVKFSLEHHEPTFTSEQSALVRNDDIKEGAKAMVLKMDNTYKLFVLSAAKKIDTKSIKKVFNVKNVCFASLEELKTLTGLVPGCVPPFGYPILSLELNIDQSIYELENVSFNAGSLTDSIRIKAADYLRISNGIRGSFSK